MEEVGKVIPVTPVSLVATAFVRNPDNRFTGFELKAEAQRLIEELIAAGSHVYVPRKDREYAVEVGLRMLTLRRLVVDEEGLFRALPEELTLLRYYANSIAHLLPASGR
jgi:glycerol-3-phosphate O-acyltransferase